MNEQTNRPNEMTATEPKSEINGGKAHGPAEAATAGTADNISRCVIEAVRDPMAITTPDGKITYVNAAMEMATGFGRADLVGTDLAGHFSSPPEARTTQQRALGGGFIPDCPLELLHRDGHRTPVLVNMTAQRDAKGRAAALIVAARNLTALRRAETELQRVNENLEQQVGERTARLESANKELEAFAYSVAHDLRAPLRSVNMFSQRLREAHAQQLDATGRATLDSMIGVAHRMGELIDDLLKLSSVSRHELSRAPVDLSLLAETVLGELQRAEPERRVKLMITPGLTARADARMIRIVFENLLSNAWKFVGGQTFAEIDFGVIEGKGVRAFFVRDNGVGFSMESAQRLFGAFERFHAPGEFPGTGIGLATVQRIIQRHGGRVWAESRINRGAAFYFTLPEASAC
jgi:PAS domain S-box-containing protein